MRFSALQEGWNVSALPWLAPCAVNSVSCSFCPTPIQSLTPSLPEEGVAPCRNLVPILE